MTDVHTRSAVAGLRGLGRGGVRAVALGPWPGAAGLWSRHASGRRLAPDVLRDPAGFVSAVCRVARERGPLVAYPVQEQSMDALFDPSRRLPPEIVVPYRDPAALGRLRDKRMLAEVAREAGVASPLVLAAGTAGELLATSVRTPCVVKAALPEQGIGDTHVVATQPELRALLAGIEPGQPLLVQEQAIGPLMSISVVVDGRGEVVARFQQEAQRVWPPQAGASRLAISVPPDDQLVRAAGRLLAGVGFSGLAQLQFIATKQGPSVIDVNPRFYGSIPLALACGVNLPAAWHATVTGRPAPPPAAYRVGVRYRWLEADLLAARRAGGSQALRRIPSPKVGAMWASDDPLPAALLAARAFGVRARGRLARGRAGA